MLTKLEIKMKGILLHFSTCLIMLVVMTGCGNLTKSKKTAVTDGQMKGAEVGGKYIFPRPYGMVYIPAGTFHMGPSDEDISASYTSKNKQVSMNDFWMDATEITNNE
ncbi:MAG: SUMF1/EgtB/PvdO family nonheme iron enzyme, partial [Chitinophagaceae bacterium]